MFALRPRETAAWLGPLLVGGAFAPSIIAYYARLWSYEHYQFFPLVLFGAYLLARRASQEAAAIPNPCRATRFGFGLLTGVSLLLLAVGVVLNSPWLGTVGALFAAAAGVYGNGGRPALGRYLPAGVMIAATLRLPLGLDAALLNAMQRATTLLAGATLDLLRVTHFASGNVIEIPGRRLLVEEACSGVNSLFSAFACTLFYLLWTRRAAFVGFVMLGSVPIWVLIGNALRIVLVVGLRLRWGIAADEGLLHDALGVGVFLFILWMLYCTERLLTFYSAVLAPDELYDPPPAAPLAETNSTPSAESVSPRLKWGWFVTAGAATALAIIQAPDLWGRGRDFTAVLRSVEVRELGESFVPDDWGGRKRRRYEKIIRDRNSAFGEHSQVWTASDGTSRVSWSLDYPFLGWHELTECYTAQGWTVERRTVRGEGPTACVAAELRHRATGRYGLLLYSLLDLQGRTVPPRQHGEFDELSDRWTARRRELASTTRTEDRERLTYQFQGFVETFAPLDRPATDEFHRSFDDLFARLRTEWPRVIP